MEERYYNENEYEKHSWFINIVRIPIVITFNLLPSRFWRWIFRKVNRERDISIIYRWVKTYRALETMYTFPFRKKGRKTTISDNFWELWWSNPRAVRNRLKLVKTLLRQSIEEVYKRKSIIQLISLGSGSARAVFEVMAINYYPVEAKLIDVNKSAIKYSQKLAATYNLNHERIKYYCGDIDNIEQYCGNGFQADIVEMVGLLDYLSSEDAIKIFKKIYKVLAPEGWFIVSNITKNIEKPFVTKGMNWPMVYRTKKELSSILSETGFAYHKIFCEPLKIHLIVLAKKIA